MLFQEQAVLVMKKVHINPTVIPLTVKVQISQFLLTSKKHVYQVLPVTCKAQMCQVVPEKPKMFQLSIQMVVALPMVGEKLLLE